MNRASQQRDCSGLTPDSLLIVVRWIRILNHMKPVVEEFKKLMEGTLEVVLVDIDQEPALTDFYTVESTPTFILFRKGQQLWRQSGELPLERLERAVKGFKS